GIDKDRIILMGSVAGGGDPAGVTAALDDRIACVVPFNFGGWQPESAVTANPDREFAWFGDGYWESTRGLRNGARDGFAHWVIVGSVAPRRVVYGHEFAWDPAADPAWPRLQKVFGFYDAKDRLGFAHGSGSVKGQPPESTHCTHIGAVHRKMVYPYLKAWFDMPVPQEYSQRRPAGELACRANPAEGNPGSLQKTLAQFSEGRARTRLNHLSSVRPEERGPLLRKLWAAGLGEVEPRADPPALVGPAESVPGARLERFALETEPGITVPLLLLTPDRAKGKVPVAVLVSQAGRAAFLKERTGVIRAFLDGGAAVCLPDLRGTGESRVGAGADRASSRTSLSQTEQILGRTVLGNQFRDLRTVLGWLRTRPGLDRTCQYVWGDSFSEPYYGGGPDPVPLDLDQPRHAEPGAATLALLATLFEPSVVAAVGDRGLRVTDAFFGPSVLVPHDAIVPGCVHARRSELSAHDAAGGRGPVPTGRWDRRPQLHGAAPEEPPGPGRVGTQTAPAPRTAVTATKQWLADNRPSANVAERFGF
ncbi:MAG TPA: hypothetical protein VH092_22330, partial [Urbifossiella sp.]|nr:hypothetical protein [Urbifossiella sp.]